MVISADFEYQFETVTVIAEYQFDPVTVTMFLTHIVCLYGPVYIDFDSTVSSL